jgi:tetratricopeptide (TPR) repeat protein
MPRSTRFSFILFIVLALSGCGLMEKVSNRIAEKLTQRMNQEVEVRMAESLDGLTSSILNHPDPGTVVAGLPAYLIMLDGLLETRPNDPKLLMAAARLYSAYASALVDEPGRAKRLSLRARNYAGKALCQRLASICKLQDKPFEQFKPALDRANKADLESLYSYSVAWAGWLQANLDNWEALAELPKIEYSFQRIIDLAPAYDKGRAQLYLAIMRCQIPANLGGKPEKARYHFEKALKYSGSKDLMVKVKYARHYARLVYDQTLHDRMLKEVLAADPQVPRLTLSNVMAQEEARKLQADEYF